MGNQGEKAKKTLFRGLETVVDEREFKEKSRQIEEAAFERVFGDTFQGVVNWNRDVQGRESYAAEVTVENALGEEVTIPVVFHTNYFEWPEGHKEGFLSFGDQQGPCRNTSDVRVRALAKKHFGIIGLSVYSHYIRDEIGKNMEWLARNAEFGEINPFDFEQLQKFPLRLTIRNKRLFQKKLEFREFNAVSQEFLRVLGETTKGNARYAVLMGGNSPDADEVSVEEYFVYDCLSHKSSKRSDSLSLRDLADIFNGTNLLQIGVRVPTNTQGSYETALLNYSKKNPRTIKIYAEGSAEFKYALGNSLRRMQLPSRFTFGKTGYEH